MKAVLALVLFAILATGVGIRSLFDPTAGCDRHCQPFSPGWYFLIGAVFYTLAYALYRHTKYPPKWTTYIRDKTSDKEEWPK